MVFVVTYLRGLRLDLIASSKSIAFFKFSSYNLFIVTLFIGNQNQNEKK